MGYCRLVPGWAAVPLMRSQDRSPGVHLSGLIRAAMEDLGQWDKEREIDHHAACRMAIGLAWEDWYGPRVFGSMYHPGEFCYQGVYFTPDVVDPVRGMIGEIKTTSKSAGTSPEDVCYWMLQVKAELWMMSEGAWTRSEFHILHLSHPLRLCVWELEFDPDETERVWQMLSEYRDKALPEE